MKDTFNWNEASCKYLNLYFLDFSVDVLDNYGNTPLFWALKHDSIEMVISFMLMATDIYRISD